MLTRQLRLLNKTWGPKSKDESRSFFGRLFRSDNQPKSNEKSEEASFDCNAYKLHRLDEGPSTSTNLTRAEGIRLYKEMVTVRRMETAAANLYKEKAIRG